MADQSLNHDFFEQLRQDNEKLRDLLGEVASVFSGDPKSPAEVSATLDSLASQLETHFEEEEDAGVFDDVLERAPRLSERIEQLKRQHQELTSEFAGILQQSAAGDGTPQWWEELSIAFHDFSTALMRHEARENELVQEAYTQDIGSKD